jgi:Protein of unknown function (DUF3176)
METRSSSSPSLGLLHAGGLSSPDERKSGFGTTSADIIENSNIVETHASHGRSTKNLFASSWKWLATDSWAMEYMGLTVAILALGSIGAILGIYDGRPLSDWPYSINMNTILSVLATALKGSMLLPVCACLSQLKWSWYYRSTRKLDFFEVFDAASRGPLGAALLLFRLKFWHLASIGSVITLLALASDAFIQQSLRFPETPVDSIASIPVAQNFTKRGRSTIDAASEVEQSFVPALYNGILARDLSQSTSAVSASCSTGNCTFPPYASIATCSACTEVTNLLNFTELEPSKPGEGWLGGMQVHSLPNGLQTWDVHSSFTGLNISATGDLNTDKLLSYQPRLLNVSAIWGDYHAQASSPQASAPQARAHQAFDCVFYLCVKTFSGSVTQNNFEETVKDSYHDPGLGAIHYTGGAMSFNMTISQGQLPSGTNLTFGVGDAANELALYMTLQLIGAGGIDVTGGSRWDNDVVRGIFSQGSSNFGTTMDNLATAMTNAMRTISGDTVIGTASKNVAHIHVRWPWLLLPLVMIILASVFLALTVWQSSRWDVPAWRSSALAVMEHGVHRSEETLSNCAVRTEVEKNSELEAWAQEVEVRLRRKGRWGMNISLVDELRSSRTGTS